MTIALVGLNGILGSPFIETLSDPAFNKEQFIAVSRDISKYKDTDRIKYVALSDLDKVVQEADILISVSAASPEVYGTFEKALSKPNKVKVYVPSTFGFEDAPVHKYLPGLLAFRAEHVANVRKLGIKTLSVNNGLFAFSGSFLHAYGFETIGLDTKSGKLTSINKGEYTFGVSHPSDIAKAVVTAVQLPHGEIPDDLKFNSDVVSPKQVIEYYEKHNNAKVQDVSTVSYEDALKDAQNRLKNFSFDDFLFYLQVIAASGADKGLSFSKDHRELLNPNETKWKWTKYGTN